MFQRTLRPESSLGKMTHGRVQLDQVDVSLSRCRTDHVLSTLNLSTCKQNLGLPWGLRRRPGTQHLLPLYPPVTRACERHAQCWSSPGTPKCSGVKQWTGLSAARVRQPGTAEWLWWPVTLLVCLYLEAPHLLRREPSHSTYVSLAEQTEGSPCLIAKGVGTVTATYNGLTTFWQRP